MPKILATTPEITSAIITTIALIAVLATTLILLAKMPKDTEREQIATAIISTIIIIAAAIALETTWATL